MAKEIYSPIRWFGGKFYLAQEIISRIPQHHCYVEPFGGGGHTLTQKKPSKIEVWNDVDRALINFLLVLRKNEKELTEALETLPTSRALYEEWVQEELPNDSFEAAVRWYYLLRHALVPANNTKAGFRSGKVKNVAFDYQNSVERLTGFRKRLRNVNIECLDFREIIERYDSPTTFFYIDPPYVGRENLYKGGFCEKDHRDLAEMLQTIQGKALVSYYDDPLVMELYSGWRMEQVNALVGTGVRKASRGQGKGKETECFFMNYLTEEEAAPEQLDLFA